MSIPERLRQARTAAGYESAAAAARRLGIPYGTYSGHENGQRGIRPEDLATYAKVFKVTVGWLAFGENSAESTISVPINGVLRGYSTPLVKEGFDIGGLEGTFFSSILEILRNQWIVVEFPLPADVVAFSVFGNSMSPHYNSGDCFLVRNVQRHEVDSYKNEELFCLLEDGEIYFAREIICGSDSYALVHHDAQYRRVRKPKLVFEIFAIVKGSQLRRAGTTFAEEFRAADQKGREIGYSDS